MPTQQGSTIRKSIALILTVSSVTLSYILINPQQSTYHSTLPPSIYTISFNTTLNATTKIFTPLNDPLRLPSSRVQDPPLKWDLPPLFVASIFVILVITLYQFSFPPQAQIPLPLPPPPPQADGDDDEGPPLHTPPQVPLRKKILNLLSLTLLFPVLITAFYTTLTYTISASPTPIIIFQNETTAAVEVVEISEKLNSLLLPDPEPPGLPAGDCKW